MLILVIAGLVIDNGGHSPRIEGTEPCTNPANGECLNLQCVSDMQDKKISLRGAYYSSGITWGVYFF